jgi:ATP-binding cassette, subfamily B, bacterial
VAAAAGSARRVTEVLDDDDEVREAVGATALGRATPCGARGRVRLENITFGYQPETPVLRDLDVEVSPGEMLALVGPSGAGKTTLVSLIPRLYDPWQGRVLIDGQDVRGATLASVRNSVALVPQDPFLLPITIAENIAYGRPSATRADVEAAARAARADEFICNLPEGYDSMIGERGATLSGGQRQRLSLARALLKDAPILIMDEPTSSLDVATERSILDATGRLMTGRTTIVIAHRLSTIRRADRIVVLDRGKMAAIGTHEQLLATSGIYRLLYRSQLAPECGDATQRLDRDA